MKTVLLIISAVAIAAMLYSCNCSKNCKSKKDTKSTATGSEEAGEDIDNKNSVLNDIYGVVMISGKEVSPKVGITMELNLAEGKIRGNGGCNDYQGKVNLEGEKLSISQIIATKMACSDSAYERAFFAALRQVDGYSAKKGILILTSGDQPVIEARRMD